MRAFIKSLIFTAGLMLAGCGNSTAPSKNIRPTEVSALTLAPQTISTANELPGRLSAYRTADIQARVEGIVLKRAFTEGSLVEMNELLYQIDPAPYQAALDSAQASLYKASAIFVSANAQAERYKTLVAAHAVSQQDYDNALSARQMAAADVAAGQAAVDLARINLSYTAMTAPIAGRIGKSLITEGALVQPNPAVSLATIQQIDPLYIDCQQPMSARLDLQGEASVTLIFDNGTPYSLPGQFLFSDISVSPTTGSLIVRALFPNPDHLLLPGMFARVRFEKTHAQVLIVPQRCVMRDGAGNPFVFLVDKDNKVVIRPVKTGQAIKDAWILSEGVQAGDVVIVDGLQKVTPGMPVKTVPAEFSIH